MPIKNASHRPRVREYARQRMRMFDCTRDVEEYVGAVNTLPIEIQIAFRRKMLGIFACQVFFVWFLVGIATYSTSLRDFVDENLNEPSSAAISFGILFVSLILLYFVRQKFPFNWMILLCFSIAQIFFFASLDAILKTNIGVVACGFTFFCVCIMIALAGVDTKQVPLPWQTINDSTEKKLLHSIWAGIIAYAVVGIVTLVVFSIAGDKFLTNQGFSFVMLGQFFMILWFSYDANVMYKIMTLDEYMYGVIYFYTDFILAFFAVCMLAFVAFFGVFGIEAFCFLECCACCLLTSSTAATEKEEDERRQQDLLENGRMERS
jgi:hypothetical protein